jgi:hypothetical protein
MRVLLIALLFLGCLGCDSHRSQQGNTIDADVDPMSDGRPTKIAINHDGYHAKHIGRTSDGRQFVLTTPFEPKHGDNPGCEYVALYLFDADGDFLEAKIERFGPRDKVDDKRLEEVYQGYLKGLGDVSFERIEIAPFSTERFGTTFGLIPQPPEDEDDVWTAIFLPGNYMAFYPPWDSGDYDT